MQRGGVHTPTTPGKRWTKKRWVSRRKDRSLSTPLSCWKSANQRQDLRVRELLERLVALPPRVEVSVGVVHEAEQDRDRPFQGSEGGSMLRLGHPMFLSLGSRMAPFLPSIHATDI